MTARKRKQGHARMLKRYLKHQTGTTDPHELVTSCNQLKASMEHIESRLNELDKQMATNETQPFPFPHSADENENMDMKRAIEFTDSTIHEQRQRLVKMHAGYSEMLSINMRMYERLVGSPMRRVVHENQIQDDGSVDTATATAIATEDDSHGTAK